MPQRGGIDKAPEFAGLLANAVRAWPSPGESQEVQGTRLDNEQEEASRLLVDKTESVAGREAVPRRARDLRRTKPTARLCRLGQRRSRRATHRVWWFAPNEASRQIGSTAFSPNEANCAERSQPPVWQTKVFPERSQPPDWQRAARSRIGSRVGSPRVRHSPALGRPRTRWNFGHQLLNFE
jgi:hypothetical protein